MRREIFRLERVEGGDQVRRPFRLPCLCQYCAHAATPRNEAGKEYCTQGLELPQYGGFCHGFTRTQKTSGNERPQQATNGLPSSADCCTMGAPKNTDRHTKSLPFLPKKEKILAHILHMSTPARILARCLVHIRADHNVRGPARARRPIGGRGALLDLPFFFFPNTEVFHV